ncbi:MAG: hypothetical protein HN534_00040 [Euryarchaeota archaeon]|jgi:hypothetical protein|nr:hypothetical protein [Euryarchaeota archaeon]MBT3653312.1 hypothetical protein [Euryarchaeota archaeon]MBT3757725.1 hypothetical protein [Euryarchaeota archaeon]MBT4050389.1 hypothetical protein [Euryarchaeota archaeon]MBT4346400.1 hypothetical protein [Euryarchaeota archaeon]
MNSRKLVVIVLSGLFLLTSWSSTWFEITAVGVYSEGIEREPTITTEYIIDSNQESFELSIDNSTPLLLYWINREDVSPGQTDTENNSSDSAGGGSEELTLDNQACSGSCLDMTRGILKLTMITMFAVICLSLVRPIRSIRIATVVTWVIGISIIIIAIPLAVATDFGISGGDESGDESSTGGFDTNAQEMVEVNQFAHFQQDSGFGISSKGFQFTYESVGFDLGLLDEEGRDNVTKNAPAEGQPGYESLIGFNGKLTIGPGSLITWWLLIAPLLILNLIEIRESFEEE